MELSKASFSKDADSKTISKLDPAYKAPAVQGEDYYYVAFIQPQWRMF